MIQKYIDLDPEDVQIEFSALPSDNEQGDHPKRKILPSAPEVAVLLPRHISIGARRNIVCNYRNPANSNHLAFFPDTHQCYFPFMYILLSVYGTNGWTYQTKSTHDNKKVELAPYFRYHTMTRPTHFNHIVQSRGLFQQFCVDYWAINEHRKLEWFRCNQKQIRADVYKGVQQSIAEGRVPTSGSTVLASSFTGGDRWYRNAYQDAMAIVRAKGKPDFFITMTLDVNCPEIKALLRPGQSPYDRPDILCRVFEVKRNKLMKMLIGENGNPGIYGKLKAHLAVVEFQKRGKLRSN